MKRWAPVILLLPIVLLFACAGSRPGRKNAGYLDEIKHSTAAALKIQESITKPNPDWKLISNEYEELLSPFVRSLGGNLSKQLDGTIHEGIIACINSPECPTQSKVVSITIQRVFFEHIKNIFALAVAGEGSLKSHSQTINSMSAVFLPTVKSVSQWRFSDNRLELELKGLLTKISELSDTLRKENKNGDADAALPDLVDKISVYSRSWEDFCFKVFMLAILRDVDEMQNLASKGASAAELSAPIETARAHYSIIQTMVENSSPDSAASILKFFNRQPENRDVEDLKKVCSQLLDKNGEDEK